MTSVKDDRVSLDSWEPIRDEDDLWGPEMGLRLADAMDEQWTKRWERRKQDLELLAALHEVTTAAAPKIEQEDEAARSAVVEKIRSVPPERLPKSGRERPVVARDLPWGDPCVTGGGPYNQWEVHDVRPFGDNSFRRVPRVPVATDNPLSLHVRAVQWEEFEVLERGAGCWFGARRDGLGSVTAEFFFNAHDFVIPSLLGWAYGGIRFHCEVYEKGAGPLVPVARRAFVLADSPLFALARWDALESGPATLRPTFPVRAGRRYYCTASVEVEADAFGWYPSANVEVAAILSPLTFCC